MTTRRPVFELRGITKAFGGTRALDGVDVTLEAGSVHALVGENGAGKSTLIKIMTGAYRRDAGTITLEGRPVSFRSPHEAQADGVVAVYQEVHVLSFSTVAETLFLGREPTRFGIVDHRRMVADATQVLARLELDLDPRARVGELPIAQRRVVAVARGVSVGAKVLILDEPTSSLTTREVAQLFALVRRLRDDGVAVAYVSHRMDEIYALCDSVTILRDGRLVETRVLAGLDRLDLVCAMLGRRREEMEAGATSFQGRAGDGTSAGEPLVEVASARSAPRLTDVSLSIKRGEIVGLAGLLGSGRTEIAQLLFGVARLEGGTIRIDGSPARLTSPRDAIADGVALLPEDRKRDGVVPDMSIRENLTLAALPLLSRWGVVSAARQRRIVVDFMERLRIKAASPDQKLRELSGGNQQKVLLARWLCRDPRLLLLDEPTRGIDVGAKREIQSLIADLASRGLGVLLISSELEELVEGSSRVVVLRDGRTVTTLERAGISERAILQAIAAAPAAEAR